MFLSIGEPKRLKHLSHYRSCWTTKRPVFKRQVRKLALSPMRRILRTNEKPIHARPGRNGLDSVDNPRHGRLADPVFFFFFLTMIHIRPRVSSSIHPARLKDQQQTEHQPAQQTGYRTPKRPRPDPSIAMGLPAWVTALRLSKALVPMLFPSRTLLATWLAAEGMSGYARHPSTTGSGDTQCTPSLQEALQCSDRPEIHRIMGSRSSHCPLAHPAGLAINNPHDSTSLPKCVRD